MNKIASSNKWDKENEREGRKLLKNRHRSWFG
jgi:hypothetical protein